MKKDLKKYIEDCNFNECQTKEQCKGCYEEYLNEKEEIDPYIHSILLEAKLKGTI